ncbi:flavodoxin family protein [Halomonas sp. ISL-60]|uniref:flavodoxin family protein n=1 Tax=Halomonas sp. ISL-56 TaxID=2819149 RepID=UPI001BEC9A49|nr:flavodoxin family protein [Halomonas sp. ISL-56]MBT2774258.1 flavodoxin family protein [Halomonas sp. ISL-60]MBT2803048.1 flavodoxin family protein [Halomonas sp. ISL-56]
MTSEFKKQLLIVAHAPSANTLSLREAAYRGASHPDLEQVHCVVKAPLEAGPDDVLACDAVLLGTTENLAYMSGALKDFFDRSYYPVLEEKQGLLCALYIRAGHDGTGTQRAVESIITGLRWRWVQPPLILRGEWQPSFAEQVEELSMTLAFSVESGIV